jgi:hypothetical protein
MQMFAKLDERSSKPKIIGGLGLERSNRRPLREGRNKKCNWLWQLTWHSPVLLSERKHSNNDKTVSVQTRTKIYSWVPEGARHQDKLIDSLTVSRNVTSSFSTHFLYLNMEVAGSQKIYLSPILHGRHKPGAQVSCKPPILMCFLVFQVAIISLNKNEMECCGARLEGFP